jgi:hypothetical protein
MKRKLASVSRVGMVFVSLLAILCTAYAQKSGALQTNTLTRYGQDVHYWTDTNKVSYFVNTKGETNIYKNTDDFNKFIGVMKEGGWTKPKDLEIDPNKSPVARSNQGNNQQIVQSPAEPTTTAVPVVTPRTPPQTALSPSNPSPSQTSGKTVHVKGYTKKDGTYVAPYNRRAPKRD